MTFFTAKVWDIAVLFYQSIRTQARRGGGGAIPGGYFILDFEQMMSLSLTKYNIVFAGLL